MSNRSATADEREIGIGDNAGRQLKALVERIERLEEEKTSIQTDIKGVYSEARGNGFDARVLRKIVAERKEDHATRQELEALKELYQHALGMAETQ